MIVLATICSIIGGFLVGLALAWADGYYFGSVKEQDLDDFGSNR